MNLDLSLHIRLVAKRSGVPLEACYRAKQISSAYFAAEPQVLSSECWLHGKWTSMACGYAEIEGIGVEATLAYVEQDILIRYADSTLVRLRIVRWLHEWASGNIPRAEP